MVSITQIDIALFSLIASQITSIFTIRLLLNEKTFGANQAVCVEEEMHALV